MNTLDIPSVFTKGNRPPYGADKGLRDGCPSSPPLFHVFHHAVMENFRAARWASGLAGKISRAAHAREVKAKRRKMLKNWKMRECPVVLINLRVILAATRPFLEHSFHRPLSNLASWFGGGPPPVPFPLLRPAVACHRQNRCLQSAP